MFRKAIAGCAQHAPWRLITGRRSTSTSVSSAVDSILLRSLKEHYEEAAKMNPPPKVSPPSPFGIVTGAMEGNGPVLKRMYGDEEISLSVMRLAHVVGGGDEDDDGINQLFVHVVVSKPGQNDSLHFLCGLYPDALGIHSVSMRPKHESQGFLAVPSKYNGPVFGDIDEKMRDSFHSYIEERGIDESLFPFLQAWLYVKDNRNLMRWFRAVGTFISGQKSAKGA
ncbi:mitochondrial acidic protein MAM33 [Pistacia vera]|uniref:mitochondrial acidic protein MAM33 n=1 Tax=Pistacia vera TaxID=55513 RepID=UPI0012632300|nr:mitochondrial acidic protein MAM33 [Pistacia vera]